jgi:hypothetical protein
VLGHSLGLFQTGHGGNCRDVKKVAENTVVVIDQ